MTATTPADSTARAAARRATADTGGAMYLLIWLFETEMMVSPEDFFQISFYLPFLQLQKVFFATNQLGLKRL